MTEFQHVDSTYKTSLERFQSAPAIHEENKKLGKEFLESCLLGMYGAKIGKSRALRTLRSLKPLNEMLPPGKIWCDVSKADIKMLLLKIDERPTWGPWEKHACLQTLRKFMHWLRTEHGYPEQYPGREQFLNLLPVLSCAPEAKFAINSPRKLKSINEIPTAQEINWILQACETYPNKCESARDKAFISLLEEIGMRIGGLGTLKISSITFDDIGALVTISDKTMQNEPIRLIKSVPALKAWLAVHPFKDNPASPLWIITRGKTKDTAMCYESMRGSLAKAVKVHNSYAESKGLPKIERRIHFHAFRYYAQTRDMIAGMPASIMCKQRGWSPTSKQPMRYARVTTDQVDKWLIEHQKGYGVTEKHF